jgi:hypothetical protein
MMWSDREDELLARDRLIGRMLDSPAQARNPDSARYWLQQRRQVRAEMERLAEARDRAATK